MCYKCHPKTDDISREEIDAVEGDIVEEWDSENEEEELKAEDMIKILEFVYKNDQMETTTDQSLQKWSFEDKKNGQSSQVVFLHWES